MAQRACIISAMALVWRSGLATSLSYHYATITTKEMEASTTLERDYLRRAINCLKWICWHSQYHDFNRLSDKQAQVAKAG
jgi:hypothetical protein